MEMHSQFPAPVYRETVLEPIFADAKRLFIYALLEINKAHVVMLVEEGIIDFKAASECARSLVVLDCNEILQKRFDGTFEDLFFLVEKMLADICGKESAGRLHTARSRNDLDMTMYRIVWRERLLEVLEMGIALRARLVHIASEHRSSLMPAYTHNQPAQPTTLGHYMLAAVETLERDVERLYAAFLRINRCPLGACAVTTTGFPINRERTAALLGFYGLQTNSYGAIASVDYIAESCAALAVQMLSLGRFVQDMLLWSTAEFGYLRLSDGYVQISSIMPQKRNPVPLEHVRVLASRSLAESQAVLSSLHNTPFADMNDSEDSLQPLIDMAFTDALRALKLMEGLLNEASFDTARMQMRVGEDFLSVTELADTLVRTTGTPFHEAHRIVSGAVRILAGDFDPKRLVSHVMRSLDDEGITAPSAGELLKALDAREFVDRRNIPGGPGPDAISRAIADAEAKLTVDEALCSNARRELAIAAVNLDSAVAALQNS